MKLEATFQPQQWIKDNAVDSGPLVRFDAAPALLQLTIDQFKYVVAQIRTGGSDLDSIAEVAGLVGDSNGQPDGPHEGPFYVGISEDDLNEFLTAIGIEDVDALSADDLESHRAAVMAPAPAR